MGLFSDYFLVKIELMPLGETITADVEKGKIVSWLTVKDELLRRCRAMRPDLGIEAINILEVKKIG